MGPLVSQDQFDRVTGYLDQGRADGVTVVTGGKRVGNEGYFVAPTVLTGVKTGMSVFREEIFGPRAVRDEFQRRRSRSHRR